MAEIDELLARIAPTWQPSMPPAMARQPTGNLGSAFEQRLPYQPQGMQMLNKAPSFPYGAQPAPMPKTDFGKMPTDYAWGSPPPPMSPTGKDMSRIPYEETPQQAPQERKAGRLDMQQPAAQPKYSGLVPESMLPILADMVKRNPDLLKNPRAMGHIITKLMPFMKKQDQERHAQAREEHTAHMETLSQERADRAERLEQYKYLHDRESYITRRMDKAWDRIKTLSDPLTEFAGDKKAELAKQQGYLKTYEEQLQSIVNDSHHAKKEVEAERGESVHAKGMQGRPAVEEGTKAAAPRGKDAPPQIFQLQEDDIEAFVNKARPVLLGIKTPLGAEAIGTELALMGASDALAKKEHVIHNMFDSINAQLKKQGKDPLSFPDANKLIVRLGRDAYDPRTAGQKVKDWVSDSIKSYFPDYEESNLVMGDLGFASRFYGSLVNPAQYEHMLTEGLQTVADTRPDTEQILSDRARSGPERILGGFEALGGALGPVGMATAPGVSALAASAGGATQEATDNPWLGLLAGALAGGAGGRASMGRTGRGAPPPAAPSRPGSMPPMGGSPFDPMRGMTGTPGGAAPGLAGRPGPSAPPPSGMMGAPAGAQVGGSPVGQMPPAGVPGLPPGIPQLPPPGPAGPARGPMPGSVTGAGPSVRPKAGLYGRPPVQGEQRPIEMPDPSIRMGGPGEQGRLPPPMRQLPPPRAPEPVDPVSRAEAAAEISAGKEPAPPVEKPSRLQADVTQFGDFTVGDKVKYRGKERTVEELIPKAPGHLAAKMRLSGLKGPVSLSSVEPAGAPKPAGGSFSEGQHVSWMPGFAETEHLKSYGLPVEAKTGHIEQILKLRSGDVARVRRDDGTLAEISVKNLERPSKTTAAQAPDMQHVKGILRGEYQRKLAGLMQEVRDLASKRRTGKDRPGEKEAFRVKEARQILQSVQEAADKYPEGSELKTKALQLLSKLSDVETELGQYGH